MHKYIQQSVLILSLTISAFAFGLSYNSSQNFPKTAFINGQTLFEEFLGKKELQARFVALETKQTSFLDSLSLSLKRIQKEYQATNSQDLRKSLIVKERELKQLSQQLTKEKNLKREEYSELVWKQINEYTREFAESNNYDFLFGANGNGSLMYGDEGKDVTQEVLDFINKKYQGL